MADETEEKKHPPTSIKLRRMRREGQVAHARDLVTLAIIPVLLWMTFGWRSIEGDLRRLMAETLSISYAVEAETIATKIMPGFAWAVASLVLPLMLLTVVLVVLFSVLDTGGFVFSAKPLAPKFERLNPGAGLKRLFSARVGAETAISLVKLAVFSMIAFSVFWGSIGTIRAVQACGVKCAPAIVSNLALPIILLSSAVFVVAAIIDVVLSRALFRREMRMSDTEVKRENKDTYGDPEVRRRRREEGRQLATAAAKLGIRSATLVLSGRNEAIGLRFVQGETAAPVIVVKARGPMVEEMLAIARASDIPIVIRPGLAQLLDQRGLVGQFVPKDTFTDVASAIIASGA